MSEDDRPMSTNQDEESDKSDDRDWFFQYAILCLGVGSILVVGGVAVFGVVVLLLGALCAGTWFYLYRRRGRRRTK